MTVGRRRRIPKLENLAMAHLSTCPLCKKVRRVLNTKHRHPTNVKECERVCPTCLRDCTEV